MLLRLRHPAVVGRHDEEGEIDCAQAGDHVADEILVPGHIDQAERHAGQLEMGETKIDRDPARFFLGQPIGIDAGQRLDQRGLAVIDMARRGENKVLHVDFLRAARMA